MLLMHESDRRRHDNFDNPILRGRDPGPSEPLPKVVHDATRTVGVHERPADVALEQAAARLKYARLQAREAKAKFDLTTGTASPLIRTSQLPPQLAREFGLAARARAVVGEALGIEPIPDDTGMTIGLTGMSSGATAAVMSTENSAVSNTDPVFGVANNSIAYIAGYVDCSRQL